MTHLRPEDRPTRRVRSACRRGRHFYGEGQHVGGGIVRRVCDECGEVSIDLTQVEEVTRPLGRMRRRSMSGGEDS